MKAKFKIEDSVRLKKSLKVGKRYDGLTLRIEMAFEGFMGIVDIDNDDTCILNNGYWYTFEMLTKRK